MRSEYRVSLCFPEPGRAETERQLAKYTSRLEERDGCALEEGQTEGEEENGSCWQEATPCTDLAP